jgi:hypothetical protein
LHFRGKLSVTTARSRVCISVSLSEYLPLAFFLPSLSTLVKCTTQATLPYDGIFQDSQSQLRAAEDQQVVRRNMHCAHVKSTRVVFCLNCPGPVWGGCSGCVQVDGGSASCKTCMEELLPYPDMEVPVYTCKMHARLPPAMAVTTAMADNCLAQSFRLAPTMQQATSCAGADGDCKVCCEQAANKMEMASGAEADGNGDALALVPIRLTG